MVTWNRGDDCRSPLCASSDECASRGCTITDDDVAPVEPTGRLIGLWITDDGSAVVELDAEAEAYADIEQHRAEAEAIVRALASYDEPVVTEGSSWCRLCGTDWNNGDPELTWHAGWCAWRRAKEWVDGE